MKKISRFATAMGTFTLGLGLAGASIALAVDPPNEPTATEKVNTSTPVSMTVVKFKGAEDPSSATDENRLAGIEFTVTPINYNGGNAPAMGSAAWYDWAHKQKTTAGGLVDATKGTAIKMTPTDDKGQACISKEAKTTEDVQASHVKAGTACKVANLAQGLYLVEETGTKAGGKNYRAALPFFITLPLSEVSNGTATWNYNPVIQPKNQEFSAEKKLTSASADSVTYTIDTSIPTSQLDPDYNNKLPFGIEDLYPTALTPKNAEVKVFIKGDATNKSELTATDDYKVEDIAAGAPSASDDVWKGTLVGDKSLAVYFTTAGAKKLADAVKADATAKVYFQIPFTVNNAGDKITNSFVVHNPNDPNKPAKPDPSDPSDPGNNGDLQFINVKITKTDAQNSATKLQGAKFNFYKCTKDADGTLTTVDKAVPGWATENGTYNNADKAYDFTTAANGEVTAYHVLNTAKINTTDENGVPQAGKYVMCAVEAEAPTDYKANPYPIEVTDAAGTTQGTEKAITIPNAKASFFDKLPKTGAAGVTILLVVGGSMALIGVAMRRRRREDAQCSESVYQPQINHLVNLKLNTRGENPTGILYRNTTKPTSNS